MYRLKSLICELQQQARFPYTYKNKKPISLQFLAHTSTHEFLFHSAVTHVRPHYIHTFNILWHIFILYQQQRKGTEKIKCFHTAEITSQYLCKLFTFLYWLYQYRHNAAFLLHIWRFLYSIFTPEISYPNWGLWMLSQSFQDDCRRVHCHFLLHLFQLIIL